jgi:RNA-directed DNA polymerase
MSATDKPFSIDKKLVCEAYKAVKANAGAAGVDGQTIEQFEADLRDNLYKIWNRMSSGSYFPPPVRAVSIPKKSGGQRILGVPTVADRVARWSSKWSLSQAWTQYSFQTPMGIGPGNRRSTRLE